MSRGIFLSVAVLFFFVQSFGGDLSRGPSNIKRQWNDKIDLSELTILPDANDPDLLWSKIFGKIPDSVREWRERYPMHGPVVILWSLLDTASLHRKPNKDKYSTLSSIRDTLLNRQKQLLAHQKELKDRLLDSAFAYNDSKNSFRYPKWQDLLSTIDLLDSAQKMVADNIKKTELQLDSNEVRITETETIMSSIQYYDRKHLFSSTELTDRIYDAKHLLFVIIGRSQKFSDFKVTIANKEGYVASQFQDLLTLAGNLHIFTGGGDSTSILPIRFVEIDAKAVDPPSHIVANWSSAKDSLVIEDRERTIWGLKLAISAANVELKNFQIANQQLTISGDSLHRKTWQSSLGFMLEIHLPRSEDEFQSIFGDSTWSGGFFEVLYNLTLGRSGLVGGCSFSTDPLSSWYYGINYSVFSDLGITIGEQGMLQPSDAKYTIGNITSIANLEKYFERKYTSPVFFVGVSLTPAAIGKALGFTK